MLLIFVSLIIYTLLERGSIDFSLGEILVGKRGKEKNMKIHVRTRGSARSQKDRLPDALEINFITSSFSLNFHKIILILAERAASSEMFPPFFPP